MSTKTFYLVFLSLLLTTSLNAQIPIQLTIHQPPPLQISPLRDIIMDEGNYINIGHDQLATGGYENYQYLWEPAGSLNHPDIPNPIASPSENTEYTVTITDNKNCSVSGNMTVFVNKSTGIDKSNLQMEISLFPNPSQGIFNFSIKGSYKGEMKLSITDVKGSVILQDEISKQQNQFLKKYHLQLKPGVYMLNLHTSTRVISNPFIIHQ